MNFELATKTHTITSSPVDLVPKVSRAVDSCPTAALASFSDSSVARNSSQLYLEYCLSQEVGCHPNHPAEDHQGLQWAVFGYLGLNSMREWMQSAALSSYLPASATSAEYVMVNSLCCGYLKSKLTPWWTVHEEPIVLFSSGVHLKTCISNFGQSGLPFPSMPTNAQPPLTAAYVVLSAWSLSLNVSLVSTHQAHRNALNCITIPVGFSLLQGVD